MGGGRQCMIANLTGTANDPLDMQWTCARKDGRNLTEVWIQDKQNRSVNYAVANNNRDLENVSINETDYLLGENNLHIMLY